MSVSLRTKEFLNNLGVAKKYHLLKKINSRISNLKNLLVIDNQYKNVNFLLSKQVKNKKSSFKYSKKFLLTYIVCFSFSPKNTLLHVTDAQGNLKFRYSAGLVGVSGKQKKNRVLVLSKFFNKLKRIKLSFLKNKPIALHFKNVGAYKYFIVKRLQKEFFIRIIKSYETYSYNGCRKKKKLHKRQRSKKRKKKEWLSGLKRQIVNLLSFLIVGSNPASFNKFNET